MINAKLYEDLRSIVHSEPFQVIFIKKDGSNRIMRCVLTDDASNLSYGLLTVFDLENNGHRNVNLNTIVELTYNDHSYTIEKDEWICKNV